MITVHQAEIQHSELGIIGSLEVLEINREVAHGRFLDILQAYDPLLAVICKGAFTQDGHLLNLLRYLRLNELHNDPFHKEKLWKENWRYSGNRAWGTEFNDDGKKLFWVKSITFVDTVSFDVRIVTSLANRSEQHSTFYNHRHALKALLVSDLLQQAAGTREAFVLLRERSDEYRDMLRRVSIPLHLIIP